MDTVILNVIFLDETDKKVSLRFNDIRSDVSGTEVAEFANKLIDDNILSNNGKSIVSYVGAQKITVESL